MADHQQPDGRPRPEPPAAAPAPAVAATPDSPRSAPVGHRSREAPERPTGPHPGDRRGDARSSRPRTVLPAGAGGQPTDAAAEETFSAWQWDRNNARTGTVRLTVQRHGHDVTLDHFGVSIDGTRIVRDNPTVGVHGFEVRDDGIVLYRQRPIASIAPPFGRKTGDAVIYDQPGGEGQTEP